MEDILDKNAWKSPEIYVLDFKQTRGGPQPTDDEDSFEHDELSPPPEE